MDLLDLVPLEDPEDRPMELGSPGSANVTPKNVKKSSTNSSEGTVFTIPMKGRKAGITPTNSLWSAPGANGERTSDSLGRTCPGVSDRTCPVSEGCGRRESDDTTATAAPHTSEIFSRRCDISNHEQWCEKDLE